MPNIKRNKRDIVTLVYWVLLFYIIAALVWWFISLLQQNKMMSEFEIRQLESRTDIKKESSLYKIELDKINRNYTRNNAKYIGEGSIFLLVLMLGAAYVYRSVRRRFYMQQQQQNFMMAVTHELKTPISVARLNLETIRKYSLGPEKQQKLIRMTLQETERLDFLTNNILVSSQLEGERHHSSKEEMDLSGLLKDCLQDFRNRYPEKIFYDNADPDMDIKGDMLLLKMLINNLLENAVKYAPKETPVTAKLSKTDKAIKMEILDEGPGIEDEEKKNVFEKFYRIGSEAVRKTPGTGLGLYLCKKIAEDHNADILVTDNVPSGCNFTVVFYQ